MMKRKKHVMESLGDQGQAPDLRSSHFLWGEARQRGQMEALSHFRRPPNHLQGQQVPERPVGELLLSKWGQLGSRRAESTLWAANVGCPGFDFHAALHTPLGFRSLWDFYEASGHANETMQAHHRAPCKSPF